MTNCVLKNEYSLFVKVEDLDVDEPMLTHDCDDDDDMLFWLKF